MSFFYYFCEKDVLLFTIPALISGYCIKYRCSTEYKERTKEVMQLSKRRQNAWISAIKRD